MNMLFPYKSKWLGSLVAVALLIGATPSVLAASAVSLLTPGGKGDTTADAVLGQLDFVHGDKNFIDGHGLHTDSSRDGDIAIDLSVKSKRVYIVDRDNHRVLGWKAIKAFKNHAAADVIFGQPDHSSHSCNYNGVTPTSLCNPSGVAVDKAGNVFIVDQRNHRVLFYKKPFSSDTEADDVFGQYGSFYSNTANNGGVSASSFNSPTRATLDHNNNLYVTDSGNHRVLVFYTPNKITAKTGSGDTTADKVFGQFDAMNANSCNNGGISANSLCNPVGIAVDKKGDVYITDYSNNRVLQYKKPLNSNTKADQVYGQLGSFTTGACNNGGLNGKSLCGPTAVVVDPTGTVIVADAKNHRVLLYSAGQLVAFRALGQFRSLISNTCNNTGGSSVTPVNKKGLCYPTGLALDAASGANSPKLYVSDAANNRVLQFLPKRASKFDPTLMIYNGQPATGVLGQYLLTTNTVDAVDGRGFNLSDNGHVGVVAIDRSVTPNRIYVSDPSNNRVLAWKDISAFASHAPATLVFGQPNPYVNTANNGGISKTSLNFPRGLAVDKAGNLYIADQENHRVLGFKKPFATDTKADVVIGQAKDFTTKDCNKSGVSADSLCRPVGLAVDKANNLYVADYSNHRVLKYNKPLKTNVTADKFYGQSGSFVSNTANLGGVSANSLNNPYGLAVDSANNLYVADYGNNRVLEFNASPANTKADFVFGQNNNFTTNTCNFSALSADSLCKPRFVAANSKGDVFIADTDNHRVLKYTKPLRTNRTADKVFGQGNVFNINRCKAISPRTLCYPDGIAVDGADNLYIGDAGYNRVLQFLKP